MQSNNITRRSFVSFAGACAATAAFGLMPEIAHADWQNPTAGTIWGKDKMVNYHGTICTYKAGIQNNDVGGGMHVLTAWAYITCSVKQPAGHLGAAGELYDASGILIKSGKMLWNTTESDHMGTGQSLVSKPTGYYYYAGGTCGFLNTDYRYVYPAYSPNYQFFSDDPLLTATDYEVNTIGKTYGSLISSEAVGKLPDLMAAQATNGTTGYVFTTDFEIAQKAPESELSALPVYLSDGITQVGEFLFSESVSTM